MELSEHIKLAAFTGLTTGIIHGIIDIIFRIFSGSFEWFEAYQSLFFSMSAFSLGFLFLGIAVWLLTKIIRLRITKKYYI